MKQFLHVSDIGDLAGALREAEEVKANRFGWKSLGTDKTMIIIFFNNSLRTRLSTQKAAMNLGMNTMVLNIGQESWKLETEMGVVMDGDKSEHIREAVPVIANFCDIIGVRSFASLKDHEADYNENILGEFLKYSGKPVISLESATVHPCQAFADLITIDEAWYARTGHHLGDPSYRKPKVVMTWAPHPRALPQAVPNSFAEWMNAAPVDFVLTQPEGYELDSRFVEKAEVSYDQMAALEGADFVYAKNWSSVSHYGQILSEDRSWTVDEEHMAATNEAFFLHCLPVRRNMIVSDSVIDGPTSLVIPEAANREISAEVVIKRMLEDPR